MTQIKDVINTINNNRSKLKYNQVDLQNRMSSLALGNKIKINIGHFQLSKNFKIYK